MPRLHLTFLSCLVFCHPLLAQAQRAELLDVYRSAVEHDAQLNAARQLYRAVREYNDARYDYIIDSLKLKQAAGSLAPRDLLELSHYLSRNYDPDRDFLPPKPGSQPSVKQLNQISITQ